MIKVRNLKAEGKRKGREEMRNWVLEVKNWTLGKTSTASCRPPISTGPALPARSVVFPSGALFLRRFFSSAASSLLFFSTNPRPPTQIIAGCTRLILSNSHCAGDSDECVENIS